MKTSKFQADLAQTDFAILQNLMDQMDVRTKADFLSKAIYFFKMAVAERKRGNQIAFVSPDGSKKQIVLMPELERVAPQDEVASVSLEWTAEQLESFRKQISEPQPEPTLELVRAMKSK